MDSFLKNKKISIVTDQISNPTWAWSFSEAIYKSMLNNLSGIYHFAGDDVVSRYEFALKIEIITYVINTFKFQRYENSITYLNVVPSKKFG